MNRDQRRMITKISDELEDMRCQLEEIRDEEESKYENLPENFQEGEQGERMQEWITALEDCMSSIDDAISYLGVE